MDRYYQTIAIIMPGQINIHSAFGKIIYDLSKRLDVINTKDLKEDNSFSLLCENLNERHGWAVFEKL